MANKSFILRLTFASTSAKNFDVSNAKKRFKAQLELPKVKKMSRNSMNVFVFTSKRLLGT